MLQPLADISNVIVYLNGTLTLWGKNSISTLYEMETVDTPASEKQYNLIKSISHLSVWLNLVLQSIIDSGEGSGSHQMELEYIKEHLKALKELDDEILKIELPVIDKMMLVVNQSLAAKKVQTIKCLQGQFLMIMNSINEIYGAQATELQLEGINAIVSNWMKKANIQLETTYVLIVVPHDPREQMIEKQYFLDLYLKAGVDEAEKKTEHIICLEMLPEQMATVKQSSLIDYLKKNQINMQIGEQMLGDPRAMRQDILAKHAKPVLRRLCPYSLFKTPAETKIEEIVASATNAILK